mmetsp:Transcript_48981/g.118616  ORF Transcript_48981/g.118616 Transcript_48981/m.118616 type:complete len:817 (-) Transcript_48981:55-2505(-)
MSPAVTAGAGAGAASAPPNKKQIRSALLGAGLTKIDNDMMAKCATLASTLHLSADQMAEVWEAYSLNKQNVTELTERQFDGYKNELIKASEVGPTTSGGGGAVISVQKSNAVTPTPAKRQQNAAASSSSPSLSLDNVAQNNVSSPQRMSSATKKQKVSTTTVAPAVTIKTYQERTNVGQVVASYKPSTSESESATTMDFDSDVQVDTTKPRCVVSTTGNVHTTAVQGDNNKGTTDEMDVDGGDSNTNSDSTVVEVGKYNINKPYRHMFTTMEDRADQLEKHLTRMRQEIVTGHNIKTDDDAMFDDGCDDDLERLMMQMEDGGDDESNMESDAPTTTSNATAASTSTFKSTLGEVNIPRQDGVTCIGRVCNEAHEGRLNETSIVLEGSRSTSGGARINVDIKQFKEDGNTTPNHDGYSLFPGQIIGIEGMNPTGRKLTVQKLVEGVPPPTPTTSAGDMKRMWYGGGNTNNNNNDGKPVKIMTACGPFTTSDNLHYDPLIDFMNEILDQGNKDNNDSSNGDDGPADVVILIGPFVDVQHDAIKSGNVVVETETEDGAVIKKTVSYEALFAEKISNIIEEVLLPAEDDGSSNSNILKTQFILVPSLDDATARWVYPQPPFQDRLAKGGKRVSDIPGADDELPFGSLGLYRLDQLAKDSDGRRRVHCMPNPCTFQINEVVFGVTSTDVIFHMSVEETSANLPPGSRVRRIAQHMVQQQSYYPLFPPNKNVNLDLKQQDGWKMPVKADVLISPTRLAPFCAPALGSTMVVNPGHLTKRSTGGTYAVMELHPIDKKKLNSVPETELLSHDVQDRLHVQVKKI